MYTVEHFEWMVRYRCMAVVMLASLCVMLYSMMILKCWRRSCSVGIGVGAGAWL